MSNIKPNSAFVITTTTDENGDSKKKIEWEPGSPEKIAAGAAAGAVLGSVVPVIGTAIGTAIGGVMGFIFG
ncbi:hypothetical protein [Lelliottia amnigena]|jgi:phage tail tape-measure protein|uniref:hypothetical protein n=1 Tax=Lelliottia amnigena TaxID=61646 RepID=UPI002B231513|nr:hypothetical protein [Lelliottia amnigena]MEA9394657.1 hypothetical protein [Lelliottia amnigena]